MARGWESKSIESQQSEPLTRDDTRERVPADELERIRRRESLEMSRRRVTGELESSRSAVHRAALENALKFLDEELKKYR